MTIDPLARNMRIPIHLHFLAIFLILAVCSVDIHADLDMHVLPGFDSLHKSGCWLPLRITLTSLDEEMTGEVMVEIRGNATEGKQIYSMPTTLFRATRKVQYLYVFPEVFRRNLPVRLIDSDGKEVLQEVITLEPVPPGDLLVLVVARDGGGLEFLADTSGEDPLSRKVHVSYSSAELLPDRWKGYDSVDVMVLGDMSVGALSADQQGAITDWVYGGGRLVVSGGAYSQKLAGTFIEELLPVTIHGTRVLDSVASLSRQFGGEFADTRIVIASSELTGNGRIVAAERDGLLLVAERELGDGVSIFLAFDHSDPAFRSWDGNRELWEKLLPQSTVSRHFGDANVARFPSSAMSARLPSYRFAGFVILLYILCLGPLSYFVLKMLDKREWIWMTTVAISAAFTVGFLGLTHATGSKAAVLSDLSLVSVYQGTGRCRISSYFDLHSPTKSDYEMKFPTSKAMFVGRTRVKTPDRRILQGGSFRLVEDEVFQMEVTNAKPLSPQSFHGESHTDFSGDVLVSLSEAPEGVTQADVVSNLPFDLTDCYVISNGRYVHVDELPPGARKQVALDHVQPGSVYDLYSTIGGEKQRVISAMKARLSPPVYGTKLIGWMEESALKTLVQMDMGEEYKARGAALIIVHL